MLVTGQSQLNQLISAEVINDAFYNHIYDISRSQPCKHVLEIGSSGGGGSTGAFVKGLRENPARPNLYCMEVSQRRFEKLKEVYRDDTFVKCYNFSSVSVSRFPSRREVEDFYNSVPTNLNKFPLKEVLRWLHQDIGYLKDWPAANIDGILRIKEECKITEFDVVLIDGSEFTGSAEMDVIYGASIMMLDDINGFKNHSNYLRLKHDSNYSLFIEDWKLRNGYAIFKRKNSLMSQRPRGKSNILR
jgi:hypothetical protein